MYRRWAEWVDQRSGAAQRGHIPKATYSVVFMLSQGYENRSTLATLQLTQEIWGKRLKAARLAIGMSQRALGIAAGIDEGVASTRVNRYELGVHAPDVGTSSRLAEVLGVPTAFLYCEDDDLSELIMLVSKADSKKLKALRQLLIGG